MGNKLVVIDGNSIANRAFYALPLLSNDEGYYTNAVYGFLTMLLRMLDEEKPTHILVAFDAGKTTFRTEEYKDYKGKRLKTPGELSSQFPLIKDLLNAFDIKHYELNGYEADDIIGTITREAEEKGFASIIVSGDKDMLQLASDQTKIALTRKGITEVDWFTPKEIMDKYGLTPVQIIDMKGLMGDPSDNIPGIPGVGEKTALKLLHQYHSVEEVLAHAEEVSGKKLQEKIMNHMDEARMSKDLATILRKAPIEVSIEDVSLIPYDPKKVEQSLLRFGFKTILQRLGMDSVEANNGNEIEEEQEFAYEFIKNEDPALIDQLVHSHYALIVEIDGDRYHDSTILGIGLSNGERHVYLPYALVEKWNELQKWLANTDQKKWVYDGKRATVALGWKGIDLEGIEFDGLLASYLSNPTESRHALSDVTERYYLSLPPDEHVYGKGAKRKVPEEEVVGRLVARKANALYHLRSHLDQEMEKQEIHSLFYDLE
ncbi:MAG TPA: DNA polymerase I, partial [Paenibacillaceae bacterium]|nr:DNA polymerase I [Paenibacillaceae bacterium]